MSENNDLKILIINEDRIIYQNFLKILTIPKPPSTLNSFPIFKINSASQGKEGLALVKKALEEGDPYALAFVDIRMPPPWDGIETIKHIWKLDPHIQIVICGDFSDYIAEETFLKLGIKDNLLLLKKPFDNMTVIQIAFVLSKKWQLMRRTKEHERLLEKKLEELTAGLKNSLSLTRATMESSGNGIVVISDEGKIIDYNVNFLSLLEIPESIIEKKDYKILFDYIASESKNSDFFKKSNSNKINKKTNSNLLYFKNNRVFEVYSHTYKLNNKPSGKVWEFRDFTKKYHLEKKLEYQASHDPLTGLPNRILLYDRIKHGIDMAMRNKSKIGIFFLDLDRFKLINDSLSHRAGDKLLIEISTRLKSSLRQGDSLARLGGDEFIVVAYNLQKNESPFLVVKKLLNQFKAPFYIENKKFNITSSIGVSIFPDDGKNAEELLQNADLAMYQSKKEGKNNFGFYSKNLNKNYLGILETEMELRNAILNNEFYLTYQAQINSVTEEIIGMEVLIRWKHPKKGIILPMDFILQAEASGIIIPIGEWILRTACQQCKRWQAQGLKPVQISVNVTEQQLRHVSFIDTLKNILVETNLSPESLELEITENVMLSGIEILNVVQNIRKLGVKVALDDFGTGNSSLNYLRQTVFDRLKIDKSFVSNIEENNQDKIIIKSIVEMAHNLGLNLIAEGVETEKQLDFLQKEQCNDIQGFYFSPPLKASDFERLLKDHLKFTDSSQQR